MLPRIPHCGCCHLFSPLYSLEGGNIFTPSLAFSKWFITHWPLSFGRVWPPQAACQFESLATARWHKPFFRLTRWPPRKRICYYMRQRLFTVSTLTGTTTEYDVYLFELIKKKTCWASTQTYIYITFRVYQRQISEITPWTIAAIVASLKGRRRDFFFIRE